MNFTYRLFFFAQILYYACGFLKSSYFPKLQFHSNRLLRCMPEQIDGPDDQNDSANIIPKNGELSVLSSLESAHLKLRGTPGLKGIPDFPLDALPYDTHDPMWHQIMEKYGLELHELSALKKSVLNKANTIPHSPTTPPSSTTTQDADIESWLEKVFKYEPHSAFLVQNDSYIEGSLFISHEKDMSSELIGVNLSDAIDKIEGNLKIPRSAGKAKPIIGTVRGIGGGKTRILEEIRQHYIRTQNVLIISITFIGKWTTDETETEISKIPKVCIALSLIARMASVFYNLPLSDIKKKIKKSDVSFLTEDNVKLLYPFFIRRIVSQVRKVREVKRFILSIDESIRMDKLLRQMKKKKADFYAPVREALLQDEFGILKGLETSLIMSTLEQSLLGETESGSGIEILPPTKLSGNKIVQKWWKNIDVTLEEKSKLVAFATMLCSIPRLAQFGEDFILTKVDDKTGKLSCKIDDNFLGSMLNFIQHQIYQRYGADMPAIPSIDVLYKIIYGFPIGIMPARPLVRGSVLTNDIAQCKRQLIDPKFSILIFELSLRSSTCDVDQVSQYLANIIEAVKTISKFKGYSLEVIFREWFSVRATLALLNPKKKISIGTLLGVGKKDFNKKLKEEAFVWLNKIIEIPVLPDDEVVEFIQESLYQDPQKPTRLNFKDSSKAYYEILKSKFPTAISPVALIVCAEGDHQDCVLMTYSGDADKPNITGIELKAREEQMDKSTKPKETKNFPDNNHEKWKLFCQMNGLSFKFIYLTTHDGETYYRDGVLVIRRAVASKFFGSLWETYLAARTVDEYTASKDPLEKTTTTEDPLEKASESFSIEKINTNSVVFV